MRVYLMRHGQAVDREDPNCPPDAERALTTEGTKRTRKAAQGLKWLGIAPATVLTSPYVRAFQTAEIVMDVLNLKPETLSKTEDLLPGAASKLLRNKLRGLRSAEVLCVGHLPHLDELIQNLLESSAEITQLKKSAVAAIDLASTGPGTLVWLIDAKMLARLGSR